MPADTLPHHAPARAGLPPPMWPLVEFFRYHGVWAPGIRLFRALGFSAKALVIATPFLLLLAALALPYFADRVVSPRKCAHWRSARPRRHARSRA